jgi:hypothetical protein
MAEIAVQKIRFTGDTAIGPGADVVLVKSGNGVTRALLPAASVRPGRSILVVRTQESTAPAIVQRVAVQGSDRIVLEGKLVDAVDLAAFGDAFRFVAVELGKEGGWLASRN